MDDHVLPFQRLNHLKQAFNNHDNQVIAFTCNNNLFLEKKSCEQSSHCVTTEWQVEKMAKLKQFIIVEFVQVQYWNIGFFFNKNRFSH